MSSRFHSDPRSGLAQHTGDCPAWLAPGFCSSPSEEVDISRGGWGGPIWTRRQGGRTTRHPVVVGQGLNCGHLRVGSWVPRTRLIVPRTTIRTRAGTRTWAMVTRVQSQPWAMQEDHAGDVRPHAHTCAGPQTLETRPFAAAGGRADDLRVQNWAPGCGVRWQQGLPRPVGLTTAPPF